MIFFHVLAPKFLSEFTFNCLYMQALVDNAEEQQNYQSIASPTDDTASITPDQEIYGTGDNASPAGTEDTQDKPRTFLVSMFVYIMRQSYVATLIIMMVS